MKRFEFPPKNNQALPDPGPKDNIDRFLYWMRERRLRRNLVIVIFFYLILFILMGSWIGLTFLIGGTVGGRAGGIALNIVTVMLFGAGMFSVMHRGVYRQFWHWDRNRAAGQAPDRLNGARTIQIEPPPIVKWHWMGRLRHFIMYVLGSITWFYMFLSYESRIAVLDFIIGKNGVKSFEEYLFFALLILGGCMVLSWFFVFRQMIFRNFKLIESDEKLALLAEFRWVCSFFSAFFFSVVFFLMFKQILVIFVGNI